MGADFFSCIQVSELKKMLEVNNWRVRKVVYDMFADLANTIRSPEVFDAHIQELFLGYLNDKVSAIREYVGSLLPVSKI